MSAVVPSRVVALGVGASLLVALGAGGIAGARLGTWASRPSAHALAVADPASSGDATMRGVTSRAGFTGFGGPPALQGDVLQAGVVTDSTSGRIRLTFESGGAEVDYADPSHLFRIGPLDRPLGLGDRVIVRLEGKKALGVLRSDIDAKAIVNR